MSETQQIKYLRELKDYWDAYMSEVIDEIYKGVGIALGLTEAEALQLLSKNPSTLQKAGFFKNVYNRFKKIFRREPPKFSWKDKTFSKTSKPMTPEQWAKFNKYMDDYWQKAADEITGDVTTKGYLLGRETANFRRKKKPYQNKSLYQIVEDQYGGQMPDNIADAYKKYDFTNAEKKVLNKTLSNVSMYVTEAGNDAKEAIRKHVTKGIEEGKSSVEIASDLYWNVEKDEGLNKHTAENLKRNWSRVAATEMAYIHENAILAEHEAEAMESLEDPSKAQYFARTGGTCEWCQSVRGTIVRLVPAEIVTDFGNESLRAMGIKDPNTNIAIWPGKNNVGRKQKDWLICCPAHPYNVATFELIDLSEEFYNKKTGRVEARQKKMKFVPQSEDMSYRSPEEKEYRKPTFIGDNLVRFNNNVYEAVDPGDFNSKLEASRKNPSVPIPVNRVSPQYREIFGRAS